MRNLLIIAAVALTSCAALPVPSAVPAAPVVVADKTVLDERFASSAELLYKAARVAVEAAVDMDRIKGANAAKVGVYDNRAFAAVAKVRAAYRAGNAESYTAAYQEATGLIADFISLVR